VYARHDLHIPEVRRGTQKTDNDEGRYKNEMQAGEEDAAGRDTPEENEGLGGPPETLPGSLEAHTHTRSLWSIAERRERRRHLVRRTRRSGGSLATWHRYTPYMAANISYPTPLSATQQAPARSSLETNIAKRYYCG